MFGMFFFPSFSWLFGCVSLSFVPCKNCLRKCPKSRERSGKKKSVVFSFVLHLNGFRFLFFFFFISYVKQSRRTHTRHIEQQFNSEFFCACVQLKLELELELLVCKQSWKMRFWDRKTIGVVKKKCRESERRYYIGKTNTHTNAYKQRHFFSIVVAVSNVFVFVWMLFS